VAAAVVGQYYDIGLRAIDITRLDEYTTGSIDLDLDDPFRDIELELSHYIPVKGVGR
jgi:hypothetical protein